MHELSIADSVLQTVRAEADRRPGAVPVKIGLRIGELAGVDPGALTFGFQALTAGTAWEGIAVDIETVPRRHRCPSCATEFPVVDYACDCPACGATRTSCIAGDELELAYIELEEP
ncbi:MAG: hydrogenase maturation nickel metallochaperone HypA [Acidobacteriota bacterium]|nr:hydrogenase maturation nickel metallochaperone HypA [Acidobacteriota bacterium]